MLKTLALLTLCFLFIGCSSEDEENTSVSVDLNQVREARQQLSFIEQSIASGQVFANHRDSTRSLVNAAMIEARSGLLILERFTSGAPAPASEPQAQAQKAQLTQVQVPLYQAELAYGQLNSSLYYFRRVGLLEGDEEEISPALDLINVVRRNLALALGKDENEWVLYKHNFGEGIEPEFRAPAGKDKFGRAEWLANFQIDTPKAQVGANEGFAWLISRSFDLSQVSNPSFRYFASYLVTGTDNKTQLATVIQTVFQTYILLDLQPGESAEELPVKNEDETIQQALARGIRRFLVDDYNIDFDVPLGAGFHDAWLPPRTLNQFKDNHKVSIGFLFDTRQIKERQFHNWSIFDFEISGAGSISSEPYTYKPLLSQGLGEMNSLTSIFGGTEWGADNGNLKVQSDGQTEVALVSPMFTTTPVLYNDRAMTLFVEEESLIKSDTTVAEILVSTQYIPGRSFSREGQGWVPLADIQKLPLEPSSLAVRNCMIGLGSEARLLEKQKETELLANQEACQQPGRSSQEIRDCMIELGNTFRLNNEASAMEDELLANQLSCRTANLPAEDYVQADRHELDLSDYQDQDFFIALYFKSDDVEEYWTIKDIQLDSLGAQLRSIPFQAADANTFNEVVTTLSMDLTPENAVDQASQEQYSDNSPDWRKSGDNNGIRISGYNKNGNRTGGSRLIFDSIRLEEGRNLIRLFHRIGFHRSPGNHLKAEIRLTPAPGTDFKDNDPWITLGFANGDLSTETNRQFAQTDWAAIPMKYSGQLVDVSFIYEASDSQAPEWILQTIDFGLGE